MKKISELDFGNNDALSYKNKTQKEKFKKWFVKDDKLDRLCSSDISFLIGEKGMGKTAYAVFMSIEEYKGVSSELRFVRDTDYKDFLFLKKENHLLFSDYTTIWEMIILLLMSKKIVESESNFFDKATLGKVGKLKKLNEAIDSYFLNSFTPEVATAIQMVRESNKAAELFAGYEEVASVKASIHSSSEEKGTRTSFQRSMYYIIKKFKDAISDLRLDKDHYMFIDGIDIRPSDVEYDEYIECIRGLSHAVLKLNGDFFQNIKDTKGYCRAILLIRPDIFESLALHNMNARIKDNSIVLNWTSNYDGHRRSSLFHAVNKMISSQVVHENSEIHGDGTCWDYYFPWDAKRLEFELPEGQYTSFISFLRLSYHRPRDIFSMLDFLKVNSQHTPEKERFSIDDFNSHSFQRDYSNYLLGEIKDQLSFYYKPEDYEIFIKFFTYLNGNYRFSYEGFCDAFESMKKDISTSFTSQPQPKFMSSANDFLQFLFELNVVCSIEDAEKSDKSVVRWCFRERTQSNLFPKIRIGARNYEIFYGLRKALQVDIAIKQPD